MIENTTVHFPGQKTRGQWVPWSTHRRLKTYGSHRHTEYSLICGIDSVSKVRKDFFVVVSCLEFL